MPIIILLQLAVGLIEMTLLVSFVTIAGMAVFVCVSWWLAVRCSKLLTKSVPQLALRVSLKARLCAERSIEFFRNFAYRFRWWLLHAWNVILLRRWTIFAVVIAVAVVTFVCSLVLRPAYSSMSVLRIERDVTDIN